MFHELGVFDGEMRGGTVAGVVEEVDGSRAGDEEEGGAGDDEGGADDDADEVILEVEPEGVEVLEVHLRGMDDDDGGYGDQRDGEEMGDQVMVTEFHVLEIHALKEIREPPRVVADLNAVAVWGGPGIATHGFREKGSEREEKDLILRKWGGELEQQGREGLDYVGSYVCGERCKTVSSGVGAVPHTQVLVCLRHGWGMRAGV